MRRERRRTRRRLSRFENNDRLWTLCLRHRARRLSYHLRMAQVLGIYRYDRRFFVGRKIQKQCRLIKHRLVSQTYELRKSDTDIRRHVEHRCPKRTALRQKSDIPFLWERASKRSIHREMWIDHAETIRTKQRHVSRTSNLGNLRFELSIPRLVKSGRDNNRAFHALGNRLAQHDWDNRRRHRYKSAVDFSFNCREIRVAAPFIERFRFRIDRVDFPSIFLLNQILHDIIANTPNSRRRTHHGNRLWVKQRLNIHKEEICKRTMHSHQLTTNNEITSIIPAHCPLANSQISHYASNIHHSHRDILRECPPPRMPPSQIPNILPYRYALMHKIKGGEETEKKASNVYPIKSRKLSRFTTSYEAPG